MKEIKHGQNVLVDGIEGFITGIYPKGKGQYKGSQHAFLWVRTPSLDYTEMLFNYNLTRFNFKTTKNGRAVNFYDIEKRIVLVN